MDQHGRTPGDYHDPATSPPPDGGPGTRPRFDPYGLDAPDLAAKADLGKRIVAAIIDGVVGAVISLIPVIGGLIAAAYWLLRDGLEFDFMDRRSIGKKIMKLRPVRLDGAPMDLEASAKRNWMFALGGVISILAWIPFIGWLMIVPLALLALVIGVVELVLVLTDPQGRRLGDKMADTQVIEVAS